MPAIETKMSDLTDVHSFSEPRNSIESLKTISLQEPILEVDDDEEASVFEDVDEEDHQELYEKEESLDNEESIEHETINSIRGDSPEMLGKVQWSYRTDPEGGLSTVTPALKGALSKHTTNSPFLRFKAAKSKFSVTNGTKAVPVKASPAKIKRKLSGGSVSRSVPVEEVQQEQVPPSPPKMMEEKRSSSGSGVSSRIQELNQKVVRVQQEKRLRKKYERRTARNPRRFQVSGEPLIRTQTIVPYKLKLPPIAKFTLSADISDDDSSIVSQESQGTLTDRVVNVDEAERQFSAQSNRMLGELVQEEEEEDDLTNFTRDSATVETVRQQPSSSIGLYQQGFHRRTSEATVSTSSSGWSRIRKNVFHTGSVGRLSDHSSQFMSDDNSTTMSSIIDKENSTYLPFRHATNTVKPSEQRVSERHDDAPTTQKGNVEPSKWRSLAAAAQAKGPTTSKSFNVKTAGARKVFGERSVNHQGSHVF